MLRNPENSQPTGISGLAASVQHNRQRHEDGAREKMCCNPRSRPVRISKNDRECFGANCHESFGASTLMVLSTVPQSNVLRS